MKEQTSLLCVTEERLPEDIAGMQSSANQKESPRREPHQHLDLGLPDTITVRKQISVDKATKSVIFYENPSKLKHVKN